MEYLLCFCSSFNNTPHSSIMDCFFSATTLQTNFKKPLIEQYNNKSYKYIQLNNNGLKVLLISDPGINNHFTCSMTIEDFGSFNDPMNYLGLTHLLEHLIIFNHYQFINQLKKMGGDINGYTMGDFMNIYFDVMINKKEEEEDKEDNEDEYYHQLNSILIKFSQLFNPSTKNNNGGIIMGKGKGMGLGNMVNDKKLIIGEINSINEEHQLNITDDDKILYHGLRLLSNVNHPFNKFATGNKSTLSIENNNNNNSNSNNNTKKLSFNLFINKLKLKNLLNNHLQYFLQPSNMILIVKSKLSLINLQNLVIKSFLQLENNHKLMTPPPPGIQPFIDSSPPLFVKYNQILHIYRNGSNSTNLSSSSSSLLLTNHQQRLKPIKIRLILPLPNKTKTQSNSNSLLYENIWCNLIGDESINSLSYYLKHQHQNQQINLINSIFVFGQYICKLNKLLLIDITTTNNQCQKFITSYYKNNNNNKTNEGKLNIVINHLIDSIWKFINQLIDNKNRSMLINCLNQYYKIFKFNLIFQQGGNEGSLISNCKAQSIDEILNLSELLIYKDIPIEDLPLGNKYPLQNNDDNNDESINVDEFIYQTTKIFDINKLNVILMTIDSSNTGKNGNLINTNYDSFNNNDGDSGGGGGGGDRIPIKTDPYYLFDYRIDVFDISRDIYNTMLIFKYPHFEILQSTKTTTTSSSNDDDDLFIPFTNSQLDNIVINNKSIYKQLILTLLSLPSVPPLIKSPQLILSNSNHKLWYINKPSIGIGLMLPLLSIITKFNAILDITTISFQIIIDDTINYNQDADTDADDDDDDNFIDIKIKNFIIIELIGEYLGKFLYYEFYKISQYYLYSWSIQYNHLINSSITIILLGPNSNIHNVLLKFIQYIYQLLFNATTTATKSNDYGNRRIIDYKLLVELKNKIRFKYKNYNNEDENKDEDEDEDRINDGDDCLKKIIDSSIMILENDIWTIEQRIDALNLIEINDIICLMKVIVIGKDYIFTNVLISTSMDNSNVKKFNQIIMNQWDKDKSTKITNTLNPQLKSLSRILIPGGNELFKYKQNTSNINKNVVVYNYIQIFHQRRPPPPPAPPPTSLLTDTRLDQFYYKFILFKFINYFIQQKFNYQFRIINQIGYMIYSGIRINKQTMGLYFYISTTTTKNGSNDIIYQEILDQLNQFLYQLELELELELGLTSNNQTQSGKLLEYIESFINLINKRTHNNNPYNHEDITTNIYNSNIDDDETIGGGGGDGGGLPINLLLESSTNHKSDNFNISSTISLLKHQIYWESIITGNYQQQQQQQKKEVTRKLNIINLYEILTPENIIKFYKSKISINSQSKSSISIVLH